MHGCRCQFNGGVESTWMGGPVELRRGRHHLQRTESRESSRADERKKVWKFKFVRRAGLIRINEHVLPLSH